MFPIQRYAMNELEKTFLLEMNALFQETGMWNDLIRDNFKTLDINCFLYRLLSGLEAGLAEFQVEPNLAMPIAMFAVDLVAEFANDVDGST